MKKFLDGRLEVIQGDITRLQVDAVVNAANSTLLGGGGVDGAIHRAGGPAILDACKEIRSKEYPSGLPAGKAVITTAGDLPATYVIHTVGPVWHGGNEGEPGILTSAYTNSLELAKENGVSSIAFPAISTGVYGYPKEQAAEIAYDAISSFLRANKTPSKVILIFFSDDDMKSFISAIES
jgi:O-acetyl-ADP-ribose deacetylase (regulator of RNase III)